jgi:hypothetical protein
MGANKYDQDWTEATEENMDSQIIRRPDFAGGGITDEEREQKVAHSELWIQRAFRTEPADPQLLEDAVKGIYRAANLAEPRVILAPSPFVMAMAGGIAGMWWYLSENNLLDEQKRQSVSPAATRAATYAAAKAATAAATAAAAATDAATRAATYAATHAATDFETRTEIFTPYADFETNAAASAATRGATYAATRDAIRNATYAATDAATYAATHAAIYAATGVVTKAATPSWLALAASFVGKRWAKAGLQSAIRWDNAYQGGNMRVSDDCFLTAARDILGLKLALHAVYAYWEQAKINGGFRWMHPKFCLVSDFPEILRVNARRQPHAEFGPSHRWRDGWSIWHINGVKVEQWMAESHPDDMDARRVLQIENVDQRRECIRRMGMGRIISQLEPAVLDTERREVGGEYRLLAVDMNHGEPWRFLQMINQSTGAAHIEAVPRECETVRHALNWRASQNINEEWFPTILS